MIEKRWFDSGSARRLRRPFGRTAKASGGGGKMQTFKLGKQMTPAELLLAYKTALEAIAKGSPDPVKIAQEALSL
jgi:hypothetical protein